MNRKIVLLVGAPGAGKGTVGKYLENNRSYTTLSTGNVIRSEIQAGTPLGNSLAEANARGEFFSDELAVQIGKKGLGEIAGYVTLDGFPRNLKQAELFDEYLKEIDEKIHVVIHLKADEGFIIDRLSGRRVCPKCGASYHLTHMTPKEEGVCDDCNTPLIQRKDDEPETIKSRMKTYKNLTEPLIEYYEKQGLVKTVRSDVSSKQMFNEVKKWV